MNIDSTKLFGAYDDIRNLVASTPIKQPEFSNVQTIFEDKKNYPDASIMVYGVYNAGKSTLINALLGKEAAAVDDIPTTNAVKSYAWKQYSIQDTPGVDAPIEHEEVTTAQMLKADVIIFVVNPSGVAEEEKTLSVLIDLLQHKKQVFLVYNEKQILSEGDFIKLKDQTRSRLQHLAAERGLSDVLKDIPIVKINARRAFNSRIQNKEKMLESSGYYTLEEALLTFLRNISHNEIYERLKNELVKYSEKYILELKNQSQTDLVNKYSTLLEQTEHQKYAAKKVIHEEISSCRQRIYEDSKVLLRTSPTTSQSSIEALFKEMGQQVSNTLDREVNFFVDKAQNDIDILQTSLPETKTSNHSICLPEGVNVEPSNSESGNAINESKFAPEVMAEMVSKMTGIVQSEHIVGGLKLVKDYIPSLMKGIGPKTMEKWAGTIVGKYIPYIGPAITVISSLWDIFSGDSEVSKQEKQINENNRQRERALQEIEDIAKRLANDFETTMNEATNKSIDSFFSNVSMQIDALRQGFSSQDKAISEVLEKAAAIHQRILAA